MSEFLTPEELSEHLQQSHGIVVATSTLATWRSRGGGPAFHKAIPARYGRRMGR